MKKIALLLFPKSVLLMAAFLYWRISYLKKHREFKGGNVYCPCCGKHYATFESYKVSREQNPELYEEPPQDVVCPYCHSYPRHRIVCRNLDEYKVIGKTSKVLIFSASRAYRIWFRRNEREYISTDLHSRLADINVDIQDTGLNDDEYDFISCDHVLEHVPDYIAALRELKRIIKPGGIALITVPVWTDMEETYEDVGITSPQERMKAYGQSDHMRVFGADFQNVLRNIGFKVTIWDGDDCDDLIKPLIGPATYDYNKVFVCTKE